jgi:hypothetical protein
MQCCAVIGWICRKTSIATCLGPKGTEQAWNLATCSNETIESGCRSSAFIGIDIYTSYSSGMSSSTNCPSFVYFISVAAQSSQSSNKISFITQVVVEIVTKPLEYDKSQKWGVERKSYRIVG